MRVGVGLPSNLAFGPQEGGNCPLVRKACKSCASRGRIDGVRVLPISALLLLSQVTYVSAQSLGAGTVRGTVTDASEAALPSTSIELSNPITGFSRHVQTNPDGSFVIED